MSLVTTLTVYTRIYAYLNRIILLTLAIRAYEKIGAYYMSVHARTDFTETIVSAPSNASVANRVNV